MEKCNLLGTNKDGHFQLIYEYSYVRVERSDEAIDCAHVRVQKKSENEKLAASTRRGDGDGGPRATGRRSLAGKGDATAELDHRASSVGHRPAISLATRMRQTIAIAVFRAPHSPRLPHPRPTTRRLDRTKWNGPRRGTGRDATRFL